MGKGKEENFLYVTNVSPKVSEQNLRDFFSFCGTVLSANKRTDRDTGLPQYVIELSVVAEAKLGLQLTGTNLLGSEIQITSKVLNIEDVLAEKAADDALAQKNCRRCCPKQCNGHFRLFRHTHH